MTTPNDVPWQPRTPPRRIDSYDLRKLLAKVAMEETSQPLLFGDGEPEFSTSHAVDRSARIVWDTNCFYRSLGVTTTATRTDLKRAYLRLEGHRSVRLTHIIKTLLDPHLRSRYDATPLGCFWADDPALLVRIKDGDDEDDGGLQVVSHVDDEWAFYLWGIVEEEIPWATVSAWRTAVAQVCWENGRSVRMAVGVTIPSREVQIKPVWARQVAFFPLGLASRNALEYARHLLAPRDE